VTAEAIPDAVATVAVSISMDVDVDVDVEPVAPVCEVIVADHLLGLRQALEQLVVPVEQELFHATEMAVALFEQGHENKVLEALETHIQTIKAGQAQLALLYLCDLIAKRKISRLSGLLQSRLGAWFGIVLSSCSARVRHSLYRMAVGWSTKDLFSGVACREWIDLFEACMPDSTERELALQSSSKRKRSAVRDPDPVLEERKVPDVTTKPQQQTQPHELMAFFSSPSIPPPPVVEPLSHALLQLCDMISQSQKKSKPSPPPSPPTTIDIKSILQNLGENPQVQRLIQNKSPPPSLLLAPTFCSPALLPPMYVQPGWQSYSLAPPQQQQQRPQQKQYQQKQYQQRPHPQRHYRVNTSHVAIQPPSPVSLPSVWEQLNQTPHVDVVRSLYKGVGGAKVRCKTCQALFPTQELMSTHLEVHFEELKRRRFPNSVTSAAAAAAEPTPALHRDWYGASEFVL